ncbi:MAG: hypothetical protein NT068_03690 [Candidatus Nomurabacteria bacterium]|nr:hypothetical protein [Candidatus Nomurabacteria bacterium]
MNRKEILKQMAIVIFFVFSLNLIAHKLYWYTSIWYFDMPMHFLGGFFIGLLGMYLLPYFSSPLLMGRLGGGLSIFLFVLIIGIGWEIFEIIFNNIIAGQYFNTLDTLSYIFFDLSGGLSAYFFILKKSENSI